MAEKRPRNSAKAIIVRDGAVLLNECEQGGELFYVFPGGGQRQGETLHEALVRECKEELGAEVVPGELLLVREYLSGHYPVIPKNVHITNPHQVEFYFRTELQREINLALAEMDAVQTGVRWLPVAALKDVVVYPAAIVPLLAEDGSIDGPVYIGEAN